MQLSLLLKHPINTCFDYRAYAMLDRKYREMVCQYWTYDLESNCCGEEQADSWWDKETCALHNEMEFRSSEADRVDIAACSDNPAVMAKILRNAALCLLASTPAAQKAGMHVAEEHPGLSMWECSENSCSKESKWTSFTSGPHVNLRGDMPL